MHFRPHLVLCRHNQDVVLGKPLCMVIKADLGKIRLVVLNFNVSIFKCIQNVKCSSSIITRFFGDEDLKHEYY